MMKMTVPKRLIRFLSGSLRFFQRKPSVLHRMNTSPSIGNCLPVSIPISGTFKAPEKANIETEKANIEIQKANIEKAFTTKTAANVIRLWEAFGYHTVFGRSDVVKLLGLKPTRSSELLRDMADRRVIVPVSGQGKGKYRFRIC